MCAQVLIIIGWYSNECGLDLLQKWVEAGKQLKKQFKGELGLAENFFPYLSLSPSLPPSLPLPSLSFSLSFPLSFSTLYVVHVPL